jgi:hypothetical protein
LRPAHRPPEAAAPGRWRDGAGGLLLLAAAAATGLVAALLAALPSPAGRGRLARCAPPTRRRLLTTLLFLGAVGLRRPWDLRAYTGDGLALLTGRRRAYGYRHVERFLAEVAQAGGAAGLTDALAAWTAALWLPHPTNPPGAPGPFYIDGHRKAVYADALVPRGLVARYGKVLGCRALVLLHDAQGHPLLATTHRGDLHLTAGLPELLARYEAAAATSRLARVVVDREGMAAEFLGRLTAEGRTVITLLRADQYAGVESFTEVGAFVPLQHDRRGRVVREVAPARFCLARPDRPDEPVPLCVALVRDLRRRVPERPPRGDAPAQWTADLAGEARWWWEAGWEATPAPAPPVGPKLIPVVTTAPLAEAPELARTYFHRWPAQENAIRDFLIPLGIDTNHGYGKTPVVNSEVAKRRETLERRLANVRRWAERARDRCRRAGRRAERLRQQAKARGDVLYRELNARLDDLERQGLGDHRWRAAAKEQRAAIDADLDGLWARVNRVRVQSDQEFAKAERYCREQREVLRALEELTAGERAMHELDDRQDQVMTVCTVALANLAMWTRDCYFPARYARATWPRLAPFFRLPGQVVGGPDAVTVTLRPFNDRRLNRDLTELCTRVSEARLRLPDGRRLRFTVSSAQCPILNTQLQHVA